MSDFSKLLGLKNLSVSCWTHIWRMSSSPLVSVTRVMGSVRQEAVPFHGGQAGGSECEAMKRSQSSLVIAPSMTSVCPAVSAIGASDPCWAAHVQNFVRFSHVMSIVTSALPGARPTGPANLRSIHFRYSNGDKPTDLPL